MGDENEKWGDEWQGVCMGIQIHGEWKTNGWGMHGRTSKGRWFSEGIVHRVMGMLGTWCKGNGYEG